MHFLTLLLPTLLAFTSTTSAWTQDPNGVWVANDNWHTMGHRRVHESCTTMNSDKIHKSVDVCAYWSDAKGGMFKGTCFYAADRMKGPFVDCRNYEIGLNV